MLCYCFELREFRDVEHINEALLRANSLFERSILRKFELRMKLVLKNNQHTLSLYYKKPRYDNIGVLVC